MVEIRLETLTKRTMQLLQLLYEKGESANTRILYVKQDDLAIELGISRQALNVHLRKLRNLNCIRTGRGFIDITETGLRTLKINSSPAFIFLKVPPFRRIQVYQKINKLEIRDAFRVVGDFDALLIVDREKLNEVLNKLNFIEGINDTRSYVIIEPLR